jgi:hypothetical protein
MPCWSLAAVLAIAGSLPSAGVPREVAVGEWSRDYRAAYQQAEKQSRPLLVWFRDDADPSGDSIVQECWRDAEWRRRLDRFVAVEVTTQTVIEEKGERMNLAEHYAFAELHRRAGLAIVDLADSRSPHYGHVVSIYPLGRRSSNANSLRRELAILFDLPPGSLTQRTMIFAVRVHPDAPLSTTGDFHARLAAEAERHSMRQAAMQRQGHHDWEQRFHQLNRDMPGGLIAREVCAESWPSESLWEAAHSCVKSWRHSSGHWEGVSQAHPAFGYDIKRGRNGIWYATGVFGTSR